MPEGFLNPSGVLDRFVGLGPDALVVANPVAHELHATRRAFLDAGALPANARVIPHASILLVQANRQRADMDVTYRDGARQRLVNVGFASAADRDRALRSLHQGLRSTFRLREVRYGFLRAAGWPLLTAAALAVFTRLSVGAARELAGGAEAVIRGRHRAVKSAFVFLLELLGPSGTALVGILATSGALAWLVVRIRRPPRMLLLSRR